MSQQLTVGPEELLPLVRRQVRADDAVIVGMTTEPMGWLNIMSGELYRARGTARTGTEADGTVDWSMVLKVSSAPEPESNSRDPAHWDYWQRELEVYRSGVTDDLPGGLKAPTFYGALERADGSIVLGLEEVSPVDAVAWSLERYREAARVMGRFSAGYATTRPIPTATGLTRSWIHSWTEMLVRVFREVASRLPSRPRAAVAVPNIDAVARVADGYGDFLAILEGLPQTFAHGDATPGNLLVRALPDGGEQFVAVDWMLAGPAAVGEEAAGMVGGSLWQFMWDPARASDLEEAVLVGYLEGLREAGWAGSEEDVRRAYVVHLALRIGMLIPAWADMLDTTQEPDWYERRFGRPIDQVASGWGLLSQFTVSDRDLA